MRVAVIGGVNSTRVLLEGLFRHGFKCCSVWGYSPDDSRNVSGWCELESVCHRVGFSFIPFKKVRECEPGLVSFSPDILFVVGLSQIVPSSMLGIAKHVNIGFHPTALPEGRGRAATAWMILQKVSGAASFFELGSGVDDGPILAQEHFAVDADDDAAAVEAKILEAEDKALDFLLPRLNDNNLHARDQDASKATWLGRRAPEDGWLDWSRTRDYLLALIRASAPPHPGAYTFCDNFRVEILSARVCDRPELGVPGRIVAVHDDGSFEVQCGDALLLIERWRSDVGWQPRTGVRLGYYVESEVFRLRQEIKEMKVKMEMIEQYILRHNSG